MLFNNIQKSVNTVSISHDDGSLFTLPEIFKFSKRYVWVGATGVDDPNREGHKMTPVHITKWSMFKGLFMGMFSASVGSYKYIEDGLHLFVSLQMAVDAGYEERVGYVSPTYDGIYKGVLGNCIPQNGVREIGYADKTWIPGKIHLPSAYDPTNDGDNTTNHSTNIYWKFIGLDVARRAFSENRPLKLEYYAQSEYKQQRVDFFASLYSMSVEERRVALGGNAVDAEVRKAARKVERMKANGFVNPVKKETVRLYGSGEEIANIDLIGKSLAFWSKQHKINAEPQPVDKDNLNDILSIVNDCNLTVEIIKGKKGK